MNLSDMTVSQLREIAADLEIFGRSKMKKADLIAAIEYAEAPSADNIPGGIDDHAAAVAKLRANREAEEEAKAAARQARNRTNYAPATESAEQADAVNAAAVEHENEEVHSVSEVAILVDAPGRAVATAAFNGTTVGGDITRVRGRWVLSYRSGTGRSTLRSTIRAKTLGKVAKQWAKALGFHATAIDIDTLN